MDRITKVGLFCCWLSGFNIASALEHFASGRFWSGMYCVSAALLCFAVIAMQWREKSRGYVEITIGERGE